MVSAVERLAGDRDVIAKRMLALHAPPDHHVHNLRDSQPRERPGRDELAVAQHSHAVADFGEAISLNPRNATAILNRANARRDLGDFDQALADYREAIRLNPRNTFALSGRGLARLRRGELDASIEDFNAALALNPMLANSLYGRSIAKRRRGDLAAANADLAAAKAIRPGVAQEFAMSELE